MFFLESAVGIRFRAANIAQAAEMAEELIAREISALFVFKKLGTEFIVPFDENTTKGEDDVSAYFLDVAEIFKAAYELADEQLITDLEKDGVAYYYIDLPITRTIDVEGIGVIDGGTPYDGTYKEYYTVNEEDTKEYEFYVVKDGAKKVYIFPFIA
ncbi:MAG: hypothetical protein QXE80_03710 [Pyrobaculum sp.]